MSLFVLAAFPPIFNWLFWNIPEINLFRGVLNILGFMWFGFLFLYAFNRFRSDLPVITSISLAVAVSLLVMYVLDELSCVMVWLMYHFEPNLFLSKFNVYVSIPIAFYTVHRFAKHHFEINKWMFILLGVIIVQNFCIFRYLIGTFGTANYRVYAYPEKILMFWAFYPLSKILWAGFFMSLWKRSQKTFSALESRRNEVGAGEYYMYLAKSMVEKRFDAKDVNVFKGTNKFNLGTLIGDIKKIKHNDFRDDYFSLSELEQAVKEKGYEIVEKGYFDNPPWFEFPRRRKAFPIPITLLEAMPRVFEKLNNRFTSHHVYVAGRKSN